MPPHTRSYLAPMHDIINSGVISSATKISQVVKETRRSIKSLKVGGIGEPKNFDD